MQFLVLYDPISDTHVIAESFLSRRIFRFGDDPNEILSPYALCKERQYVRLNFTAHDVDTAYITDRFQEIFAFGFGKFRGCAGEPGYSIIAPQADAQRC